MGWVTLQAISIDTALSKAIRTARMPVCAIPSLSALGFGYSFNGAGYPTSSTAPNVPLNTELNALAGLVAGPDNAYLGRSRSTYGLAVETYAEAARGPAFAAGAGYPAGQVLAQRLSSSRTCSTTWAPGS